MTKLLTTQWAWWALVALVVGVALLKDTAESRTLPRVRGLGQQMHDAFHKLLHNLDDAVSKTPKLLSTTIAGMFKKVTEVLNHAANISVYRANWFMKCLGNCLHIYNDHGDNDKLTVDGLMSNSNITVRNLFNCNRHCLGIDGIIG